MERTDEELVLAYRAGDESTLRTLVERYTRRMYTFVYRTIKDTEAAEDIVQDIFVKVWKYQKKFKTTQSFKTWIYTIARNTVIDWLRKRKDIAFSSMTQPDEAPFSESLSDDAVGADKIFEQKEIKQFLLNILDEIPEESRMIMVLHADGLTFEEIAVVVKKPMNTVKSQYRRTLDKLREVAAMHQKGQNMRIQQHGKAR